MLMRDSQHSISLFQHLAQVETLARLLQVHHTALSQHSELTVAWQEDFIALIDKDVPANADIITELTWSSNNSQSLINEFKKARQIARVIQPTLGQELWQTINRLYCWLFSNKAKRVFQRMPYMFYQTLLRQCQLIQGLLHTQLPHNEVFYLCQLGYTTQKSATSLQLIKTLMKHISNNTHEHLDTVLNYFTCFENFMKLAPTNYEWQQIFGFVIFNMHAPNTIAHQTLILIDTLEKLRNTKTIEVNEALTQANHLSVFLEHDAPFSITPAELKTTTSNMEPIMQRIHQLISNHFLSPTVTDKKETTVKEIEDELSI